MSEWMNEQMNKQMNEYLTRFTQKGCLDGNWLHHEFAAISRHTSSLWVVAPRYTTERGTQCFSQMPNDKLKSIYPLADRNTKEDMVILSTSKCIAHAAPEKMPQEESMRSSTAGAPPHGKQNIMCPSNMESLQPHPFWGRGVEVREQPPELLLFLPRKQPQGNLLAHLEEVTGMASFALFSLTGWKGFRVSHPRSEGTKARLTVFHWHAQVHRADHLNSGSGLWTGTPCFSFLQMPIFGNLDGINLLSRCSIALSCWAHVWFNLSLALPFSKPSLTEFLRPPWKTPSWTQGQQFPFANQILGCVMSGTLSGRRRRKGHSPNSSTKQLWLWMESFNLSGLTFLYLCTQNRRIGLNVS